MKPDWDKLTETFADSKHSGIYDVDCTADGKELCEEVGVQGYPTIKYGDPADKKALKVYEGGRDFESLKKFAEDNLGPICAPASMDACDDEERQQLEAFLKQTSEELEKTVKKLEKGFTDRQKKLSKKTAKLSEQRGELRDDEAELGTAPPKKGKEKQHEAKKKQFADRRAKLDASQAEFEKAQDELKADMKKSGVKLMKLAAKAKKGKQEL